VEVKRNGSSRAEALVRSAQYSSGAVDPTRIVLCSAAGESVRVAAGARTRVAD